jgi:hypothetical protein
LERDLFVAPRGRLADAAATGDGDLAARLRSRSAPRPSSVSGPPPGDARSDPIAVVGSGKRCGCRRCTVLRPPEPADAPSHILETKGKCYHPKKARRLRSSRLAYRPESLRPFPKEAFTDPSLQDSAAPRRTFDHRQQKATDVSPETSNENPSWPHCSHEGFWRFFVGQTLNSGDGCRPGKPPDRR